MVKVLDTEKNIQRCICPKCPTFLANQCPAGENETLYCARGKTQCDLPDKGCICGLCPLWEECNLSRGYFCFNGAAE